MRACGEQLKNIKSAKNLLLMFGFIATIDLLAMASSVRMVMCCGGGWSCVVEEDGHVLRRRMVMCCGGGWSCVVEEDGHVLWRRMVMCCGGGWSCVVEEDGHVLWRRMVMCCGGGWSCVVEEDGHVLWRRMVMCCGGCWVLRLKVKEKCSLKSTWKRQVEKESIKVGLSLEDVLC